MREKEIKSIDWKSKDSLVITLFSERIHSTSWRDGNNMLGVGNEGHRGTNDLLAI